MTDDPRLVELLDEWEEAQEEGCEVSPEQLCDDCPELLEELQRQIQILRGFDDRVKTQDGDATGESTVAGFRSDETVVMHSELSNIKFHAKGGLGLVLKQAKA